MNNLEFKNKNEKYGNTTISFIRCAIFAPTLKSVKNKDIIFENAWGKLKILKRYNKLTQMHINVLDAIMDNKAVIIKLPNGEIAVKFIPYAVLKMLGQEKNKNYKWLQQKLDDLISTVIEVETKDNVTHEGILHKARWSKTKILNFNTQNVGLKGNQEHFGYYYVIVFNAEFAKFFDIEINLNYKKILPDIINIKSGILQAFVRFCISHNELNMTLDDVLKNIRAFDGITERQRQRIKKGIKYNIALLWDKFKIRIKENGIVMHDHNDIDGVYFLNTK
jgi:hypothetical protein